MKKITLFASAFVGLLASALSAGAQVFTVPSSTAATLTANVGSQMSDAGFLAVLIIAASIPLVFYVAHQLIGLIPKGRSGRR